MKAKAAVEIFHQHLILKMRTSKSILIDRRSAARCKLKMLLTIRCHFNSSKQTS